MAIKRILYQKILKAAPALSGLLPKGLRRALMARLTPSHTAADRIPYEQGAYSEGVNLMGYLKAPLGLGQGARLYARAIAISRMPHVFVNTTVGNNARSQDVEFALPLSNKALYRANIIHVNAEQMPFLYKAYPKSFWDRRYNIGVWLWELETFPEQWKGSFAYLDEIWTPSSFTTASVAAVSPLPVTTVAYGIQAQTDPRCDRAFFGLPNDQFLFLSMYDVNSFMTRKNPLGAIDAFLAAFGGDHPDAGLVIKAGNARQEDLAALRERIGGGRSVYILSEMLPKAAVNSLIGCCDCLVSLHRSEGFGLVIAEAMWLGVPVVATNWSANTDFMNEGNSCPVEYRLVDVGDGYTLAKPGQRWADPDIGHAAHAMRRLFEDDGYRSQIALAGQRTIREDFSLDASARKMKERLGEVGVIGDSD